MKNRWYIFTPLIIICIFLFEGLSGHLIDKTIDNLFLISVDKKFYKTILGGLCLKINNSERIYDAKYILDEKNQSYILKPLKYLVDIASWKEKKSDNKNISVYMDKNNIYKLYYLEDVFLTCSPKNKNIHK